MDKYAVINRVRCGYPQVHRGFPQSRVPIGGLSTGSSTGNRCSANRCSVRTGVLRTSVRFATPWDGLAGLFPTEIWAGGAAYTILRSASSQLDLSKPCSGHLKLLRWRKGLLMLFIPWGMWRMWLHFHCRCGYIPSSPLQALVDYL